MLVRHVYLFAMGFASANDQSVLKKQWFLDAGWLHKLTQCASFFCCAIW
uniref:Uncharacterized protein n=1 Tax=Arundo donax TaxID=35708 RepID=A0A0A9AD24_ARUDO